MRGGGASDDCRRPRRVADEPDGVGGLRWSPDRLDRGRLVELTGLASAGAVPGPATFAMGGEAPTLTDADVVTGLLQAGKVFGGQFVLDGDRALAAMEAVASQLECSGQEAAVRIEQQAAEELGSALSSFLERRQIDPWMLNLYAFGGAGPVHMPAAASAAGIRRLRTFPFGSGFSAFGCTVVDVRHRYEAAVAPRAQCRSLGPRRS